MNKDVFPRSEYERRIDRTKERMRRGHSKIWHRKKDRIGYSMGLGYPLDWGEHTASIRPGDDTVLEEDMTFHMIPGIWGDDFGVEISETFHVTANGAETLAEFPRELFST